MHLTEFKIHQLKDEFRGFVIIHVNDIISIGINEIHTSVKNCTNTQFFKGVFLLPIILFLMLFNTC